MSEKFKGGAFHHVAMSVKDLSCMLPFYRDELGFELLWELDHIQGEVVDNIVGLPDVDVHIAMFSGYGARLELFQYHNPAGKSSEAKRQCDFGLTHFCIFVDDPRTEYERLRVRGADFLSPPQNHRPDGWVVYMKDPEGNVIELLNPGPTAI